MRTPKGAQQPYRPPIKTRRTSTYSHGSGPRKRPPAMQLERNGEGVLYFVQPQGNNGWVTWHIYPSGNTILRQHGIDAGQAIPTHLYTDLKLRGYLYTDQSGTSGTTGPPQPNAHGDFDLIAYQGFTPSRQLSANRQPSALTEPGRQPYQRHPAPPAASGSGTRPGALKATLAKRPHAEIVTDPAKRRLDEPPASAAFARHAPAKPTPPPRRPPPVPRPSSSQVWRAPRTAPVAPSCSRPATPRSTATPATPRPTATPATPRPTAPPVARSVVPSPPSISLDRSSTPTERPRGRATGRPAGGWAAPATTSPPPSRIHQEVMERTSVPAVTWHPTGVPATSEPTQSDNDLPVTVPERRAAVLGTQETKGMLANRFVPTDSNAATTVEVARLATSPAGDGAAASIDFQRLDTVHPPLADQPQMRSPITGPLVESSPTTSIQRPAPGRTIQRAPSRLNRSGRTVMAIIITLIILLLIF